MVVWELSSEHLLLAHLLQNLGSLTLHSLFKHWKSRRGIGRWCSKGSDGVGVRGRGRRLGIRVGEGLKGGKEKAPVVLELEGQRERVIRIGED